MKLLRSFTAPLFCAVVLAGCASNNGPSTNTVAGISSEDTVVCGQEASTGTRIATTRCRKVVDIEARRKADREAAEALPTELPTIR